MERIRISCIIPTHNRANLIGETLTNLLGQTRPPDELIVIDDGSTDGSADVIAGFGTAVTLIRQANAGPAAARNHGLAVATGELIQFMDSDDLCTPDKLQLQSRALEASDAPFVYGPWLQGYFEAGTVRCTGPVYQQYPFAHAGTALSHFLSGWFTLLPACLFRRSVFEKIGTFRTDLLIAEDLELLFRILQAGFEPKYLGEGLLLCRMHDGQQISRGAISRARHAVNWSRYLALVGGQIEQATTTTRAQRARWRCLQRDAAVELADLGIEAPALPFASVVPQACWRYVMFLRGIGRRVSVRLQGSPHPASLRPGRLSLAQQAGLAALGYRAEWPRDGAKTGSSNAAIPAR